MNLKTCLEKWLFTAKAISREQEFNKKMDE